MPYRLHISEDEVREELQHLGYTQLPDELVAAFRKDLLKLIKKDIKRIKERRCTEEQSVSSKAVSEDLYSKNEFSSHNTSQPMPRTSFANRSLSGSYSYSMDSFNSLSSEVEFSRTGPQRSRKTIQKHSSSSVSGERDSESGYSECSDDTEHDRPTERSSSSTSTSGVSSLASSQVKDERIIRPRSASLHDVKRGLPPYPARPDPVSLYHYYKAHWDARPPPGDDPRYGLRWKIRAQLFYSK